MILLDGKRVATHIYEELSQKTKTYLQQGKRPPHLAIVFVGRDVPSEIYVRAKMKIAEQIRFRAQLINLPEHTTSKDLIKVMHQLAEDEEVDAIIVQFPLPPHLHKHKEMFVQLIPAHKDVDGFHFENIGSVFTDFPALISATPYGIVLLLRAYNIQIEGKHIVVVGRSHIVGKPLALLLASKNQWGNATVTLCHSYTTDVAQYTRQADIVVVAIGCPYFLRREMVKEGAIVIDVGINRIEDPIHPKGYTIVGDVCTDELKEKVAYISPVPGGVGPMTIAALMKNTLLAYERNGII